MGIPFFQSFCNAAKNLPRSPSSAIEPQQKNLAYAQYPSQSNAKRAKKYPSRTSRRIKGINHTLKIQIR